MAQLTTLQIINKVQEQLRLPQSVSITDAHAALLLSMFNKTMRIFMQENVEWGELKVHTTAPTVASTATVVVSVTDEEIDIIKNIQIGNNDPLEHLSDADFRDFKRNNTAENEPQKWRIYSKSAAGTITVEVCPTPDAVYTLDIELVKKPKKSVAAGDLPPLDEDTIMAGMLFLAKEEQGVDFESDRDVFLLKLGLEEGTQGAGNWGDVEPG